MSSRWTVVSRLSHGLGNQLFQVAAALKVATYEGAEVCLDLSYYSNYLYRSYELHQWALPVSETTPEWTNRLPASTGVPTNNQLPHVSISDLLQAPVIQYVREKGMGYRVDKLPLLHPPLVLEGYWQHWRNAGVARAALGAALRALPLSAEAEWRKDAIAASRPCGVHVRRTDFLHIPTVGAVGPKYIRDAIKLVRTIAGPVPMWFFSDDIPWCRQMFGDIPDAVFPDPSLSASEDLYLMASCRSHIISNSTFGWWGAYLSEWVGPVVMPKKWHSDPRRSQEDLWVTWWIRIPNTLEHV